MSELNLSGEINYLKSMNGIPEANLIDGMDVIRDLVIQLDSKIIMSLSLMVLAYVMANLILPRVILGLEDLKAEIVENYGIKTLSSFFELVLWISKALNSFFDTLGIGLVIFVLSIAYIQGIIPYWANIMLIVLAAVIFLIALVEVLGYFITGKYRNFGFQLGKILNKIDEDEDGK